MIRIGILGAGRVVNLRYIEVLTEELQGAKVTLVCDRVRERAEKVSTALKARLTIDEDELFESQEVDLILVATESGKHYMHARKALLAGKHVIVEKPPAMFAGQILENEQLASERGLMFACVFQNRLNPAMRILKQNFETGRFGKLVLATIRLRWCRYQDYYEDGWHGTWEMDGGVINQQAIHHIDALQWVCGRVSAACAAQANALNHLEAEDTTVAVVRFVSGALGVIEATTAARPEDFEASMSVVGEKGMAVIGGIALNLIDTWNFIEEQPEDSMIPARYSQEVPTGYGLSHGPLLQEVVDRLNRGETVPPITGSDTVSTVNLVHALYRSAEINGWVELAEKPISERLGKG